MGVITRISSNMVATIYRSLVRWVAGWLAVGGGYAPKSRACQLRARVCIIIPPAEAEAAAAVCRRKYWQLTIIHRTVPLLFRTTRSTQKKKQKIMLSRTFFLPCIYLLLHSHSAHSIFKMLYCGISLRTHTRGIPSLSTLLQTCTILLLLLLL